MKPRSLRDAAMVALSRSLLRGAVVVAVVSFSGAVYHQPHHEPPAPTYRYFDLSPMR